MADNSFGAVRLNVQSVLRLLLLLSCLPGEFALTQTTLPAITLQPRSQSVSLGADVTFRVTATGTPPLRFQWRWNETPVDGVAISMLALTNVTLTRAGVYYAIVSNDAGAATSAVAVLTVDPTFTRITTGLIATDGGDSSGCAWGDFDNDGFPDLFVGNGGTKNFLYRNNGDGTFTKLTNAAPALDSGFGGSWGDFNNDGWLDLFSANDGGQNNTLYHNNGDGTFGKITTGSLVNDGGNSAGCAWADYDNDGFLDLFVANWQGSRPNFLYRNNGNTNHWLKVKCLGAASNRAGIGVKVRLRAKIRTVDMWQLREISGGTGFGQTSLLAHFGLGDAAIVDTVRIEWLSGAVQELHDVSVNQTLTVVEPPKLAALKHNTLGFQSDVVGLPGSNYVIETSLDLTDWAWLTNVTNAGRSTTFSDPTPPDAPRRFYRARSP